MKRGQWLLSILLLIATLSGCAGRADAVEEPVAVSEVSMPPSYRFEPATIRVPAGTAVTWNNEDNFTHSVQITDTDLPVLDLRPGESGSIAFDEAGEYPYICTYHPHDMQGTVIVTQP